MLLQVNLNLVTLLQTLLELFGWVLRYISRLCLWLRLRVSLHLYGRCLTHLSLESAVLDILISSNVYCLNLIDLFKEI